MKEQLKIICKNCKLNEFIVFKPTYNLLNDSKYWWCTECVYKSNRENMSKENDYDTAKTTKLDK